MNVDSMRMAAQRFRDIAELPPKVVAKKTKITPVIGRELKSIIKQSPKTPYREQKGMFEERLSDLTDVSSSSSIQRYLNNSGYKRIMLPKKALIHPRNISKRLKYAEDMKGKGSDFWDAVIWSDETFVAAMSKGKEVLHWVHQFTKREDLPVNWQIVGGGSSVMLWGFQEFVVFCSLSLHNHIESLASTARLAFTIFHRFSMGFRSGDCGGQSISLTSYSLKKSITGLMAWSIVLHKRRFMLKLILCGQIFFDKDILKRLDVRSRILSAFQSHQRPQSDFAETAPEQD
jgi:hypothetical protein